VAATLEDMLAVLGDRKLTVCRELTKMHEEVWRTTIAGALERYGREEPRGEFTLAIEGSGGLEPDLETEEPG
jgi:16S rRNA (cytidine1402-2'-O)-methyltransferase